MNNEGLTLLTPTKDGEKERAALAQYIIRNTFSLEKLTYNREIGTDIYRSKMTSGKNKILHKFSTGFQIYTAEEFIAAIIQHIPEKSFQMIRYLAGIQTNLADYEKNRAISHQMINRLMKLMKLSR